MEYTINISQEVLLDIKESEKWYESQSLGLGKNFRKVIEKRIELIQSNPEMFREIERDERRAILGSSFPYNIYYSINKNEIKIKAVLHQQRELTINRHDLEMEYLPRIKKMKEREKELEKKSRRDLLREIRERQEKSRDLDMDR